MYVIYTTERETVAIRHWGSLRVFKDLFPGKKEFEYSVGEIEE